MSKLCIVVPTYNEARNLPRLVSMIEDALRAVDFILLVVDDNSADGTARVAEELNSAYGNIVVLRRAGKLGLGSAVVDGLRFALEVAGAERIVTMDADLSHSPGEIPRLLSAARKADLVQGSRYVESGCTDDWSPFRRLVSRVANLACRLLLGANVRDCTGNFRVYSKECAGAVVSSTRRRGFDWVVEAMFLASRCGVTIKEVPISFGARGNGKTKLSVLDLARWASFLTRTVFSKPSPLVSTGLRPSLAARYYSDFVIHKSSTFTVTSAAVPATSITMYTLSSTSPDVSAHAELMYRAKSSE